MIKKLFCLALILICVCLCTESIAELQVYFIDVGQGDAIVVSCDGKYVLIDAGPVNAGIFVNNFLKEHLNISKLDGVIATHNHDDHIGGMPTALNGLTVDKVFTSPTVSMFYWFDSIQPVLRQETLEVTTPEVGDTMKLGDALLTFLNSDNPILSINNRSTVVRVDYGNTSFLLVGDAEGDEEQQLINSGVDLSADFLKIGHHGGLGSTGLDFLNAISPKCAIISVGANNDHGHPAQETLTLLENQHIEVYRTDLHGTITCISNGDTITIEIMKALVK